MKRILGTVAALAGVLAFGMTSSAAVINIDVAAAGGRAILVNGLIGGLLNPIPMVASSTVSIETATGGTLGAVSLLGGSLHVVGAIATGPSFADSTLTVDYITTLLPGGTGTLTGDDILWDVAGGVFVSTVGTFVATGSLAFITGATGSLAVLNGLTGAVGVNPIILGTWDLDAGLTTILGSSQATVQMVGPNRSTWLLFGAADLGHTVPEPGAFALVLLGIGGLALRSRKA